MSLQSNPEHHHNQYRPRSLQEIRIEIVLKAVDTANRVYSARDHEDVQRQATASETHFRRPIVTSGIQETVAMQPQPVNNPYDAARQNLENIYSASSQDGTPGAANDTENVIQMPIRADAALQPEIYPVIPQNVAQLPPQPSAQRRGNELPIPPEYGAYSA